ncbi:Sacchrp-dh-NADP domain-containing protein [Mycena chlorophos]|uniref:Sacchrp-dh-NADP domain-containing protein n=1 Tax=Mycena chlorophos TaxID=658473 RepID=A0A8H6S0Q4_MYCCL|nr:Sacchrp-dh-NADP domain-containing protein [Mycena chlorophos]
MSAKPVLLVLGATGFTGRLVARYLSTHRDRDAFELILSGRSQRRLDELAKDIALDVNSVELKVVDVTSQEEVDEAVGRATVVINNVGPFSIWGSPVVESCARQGVHYVDLTGETNWIVKIIQSSHFLAMKTGALIVPSSAFDSVPADLLPYVAAKKLREVTGKHVDLDTSVSAYSIRGSLSGGTLATVFAATSLSTAEAKAAMAPFALSPSTNGAAQAASRFVYRVRMPDTKKMLSGSFFFMSPTNRPLQQRSWGLLEMEAAEGNSEEVLHYGPHLKYDEFFVTGSRVLGFVVTWMQVLAFIGFLIPPTRWFLKRILPKPGEGPSEQSMQNGRMKVTNVTTTVPIDGSTPLHVKTVMEGKGDPGYRLAAVMISEAALSIALQFDELPAWARRGGVLTPATAFGDVLPKRLDGAGISIRSQVFRADGSLVG